MAYGLDTAKILNRTSDILDCSYLDIDSLPKLEKGLTILRCSDTKVSLIPELPEGLVELTCCYLDNLHTLPKLPSTLKKLDCRETALTYLPELPEGLEILVCNRTAITHLPALPKSLQILRCSFTPLLSLPSLGPNLKWLILNDTYISELPKPFPNLTNLSLNRSSSIKEKIDTVSNRIILSELPDTLQTLNISNTLIGSLPNIPKNLQSICLTSEILENTFYTLPDTIQYVVCTEGDCFRCEHRVSSFAKMPICDLFVKWINDRFFKRTIARTKLIKSELIGTFIN